MDAIPEQTVNAVENYVEGKIVHLSLFGLGYLAPQPVLPSEDMTVDVSTGPTLPSDYTITDASTEPVLPSDHIIADVSIEPEVLNLESEGRFVTVYIELDKKDIKKINKRSISIVKINLKEIEPIYAEIKPTSIGDHDSDGIPDLMVKISRDKLQAVLSEGENEIILTGGFSDDIIKFIGKCKIKAIKPKKEKPHTKDTPVVVNEKNKTDKSLSDEMSATVEKDDATAQTSTKKTKSTEETVADDKKLSKVEETNNEKFTELKEQDQIDEKPNKLSEDDKKIPVQRGEKPDNLSKDDKKIHKVKEIKELNSEKIVRLKEQGLKFLNSGVKFETEDVNQTYEIRIPIPNITTIPENIAVYFWNDNTKQWQRVKHYIDEKSKEIKVVDAKHGYYILATILDPSFGLKQAYVYPNPAKLGENPKIYIECGLVDKIELTILDILGNIIYAKNITNGIITSSDKYTYEHEWNIKDIPSGIYIYRIHAERIGYKPINIIGKIAIIK